MIRPKIAEFLLTDAIRPFHSKPPPESEKPMVGVRSMYISACGCGQGPIAALKALRQPKAIFQARLGVLCARSTGVKVDYSPPTVRPSTRIVGAATDPRNSKSFAISEMLKNNSFRLPATVISSTG
jgi:hypothetical protein